MPCLLGSEQFECDATETTTNECYSVSHKGFESRSVISDVLQERSIMSPEHRVSCLQLKNSSLWRETAWESQPPLQELFLLIPSERLSQEVHTCWSVARNSQPQNQSHLNASDFVKCWFVTSFDFEVRYHLKLLSPFLPFWSQCHKNVFLPSKLHFA